jgi:hypothetical protein
MRTGQYIKNTVERDFSESRKQQFYKMTGNTIEINNPSIAFNRFNKYPNSYLHYPYIYNRCITNI